MKSPMLPICYRLEVGWGSSVLQDHQLQGTFNNQLFIVLKISIKSIIKLEPWVYIFEDSGRGGWKVKDKSLGKLRIW